MIVQFVDGTEVDDRRQETYGNIRITAVGLVATVLDVDNGLKVLWPWHVIRSVGGFPAEFEHELEQAFYIGVGS